MGAMSLGLPRDLGLLLGRLGLAALFVITGWQKLMGFSGAEAYVAHLGLPVPVIGAIIATAVELGGGLLIALGVMVTPVATGLAVYTVITALVGHPYWSVPPAEHTNMFLHFWKNISIAGGFLALAAAGSGRYALIRN